VGYIEARHIFLRCRDRKSEQDGTLIEAEEAQEKDRRTSAWLPAV
jgi:hypothetical protein